MERYRAWKGGRSGLAYVIDSRRRDNANVMARCSSDADAERISKALNDNANLRAELAMMREREQRYEANARLNIRELQAENRSLRQQLRAELGGR